jgi:hypothetical protein
MVTASRYASIKNALRQAGKVGRLLRSQRIEANATIQPAEKLDGADSSLCHKRRTAAMPLQLRRRIGPQPSFANFAIWRTPHHSNQQQCSRTAYRSAAGIAEGIVGEAAYFARGILELT